jgi:hypothetical protein
VLIRNADLLLIKKAPHPACCCDGAGNVDVLCSTLGLLHFRSPTPT